MALLIPKKKIVVAPATAEIDTDLPIDIAELVVEIGQNLGNAEALEKQVKSLTASLKAHKDKVKLLVEKVTKHAIDAEIPDDGEKSEDVGEFVLAIGKAGVTRSVKSTELAMKLLGKKVFLEKCTIGLGVIDQYLTPEEKQDLIITTRGERSVKITRKMAAQQAA